MARWHPHTSLKLPAHPQLSLALAPFASFLVLPHSFCFILLNFSQASYFKLSQTGVALSPSVWHLWGIMVVGKWVVSKIRNKVTSGVTTNTSILSTAKLYKVPSMSGISWLFQGFAELNVSACFCWDHVFYREMPCQSELVCVDLWANTLILERISKNAFWQFVCAAWGWDFKLCTKREMWNLACVLLQCKPWICVTGTSYNYWIFFALLAWLQLSKNTDFFFTINSIKTYKATSVV